jgi:PAS domain S-box-containing protein
MNRGYSSGYSQLSVETQRLMLAAMAGGVGIWDYDIDAGVLYQNVFRIIRPGGELRWLRSAACLVDAEHGRPRRAIGFVQDVTERHLAETHLRQSLQAQREAETRLRDANASLELRIAERTREYDRVWMHSRDLQVVAGVDGILRAVSPAWTRVLGHQAHEVVGHSFREFILPADLALTEELYAAAAQGVHITNFQVRLWHRDGSYRWIAWHTAFEDDLIYAYGRDITAEKSAVDALERSEAWLRTMFETSYQHQILLTSEGGVADVNSVALRSIGARREQVVGVHFADTPWFATTRGMPVFVSNALHRCAAGATVHSREIEVVLPGERRRWFEFTLRPIRDSHGNIVAMVYEAVDLTERRHTEAVLRQAQKMEAVGQLTGGIAHDFNNLLQGIVVPLRLMQKSLAEGHADDLGRFLEGALASTERGVRLTRRLLDFSRDKPQHPEPAAMNRLIDEVMELLRQSTGAGISLLVKGNSTWLVCVDPSQFENVLLNLCINARDAMAGSGTIVIETRDIFLDEAAAARRNLAGGDYACLRVIDSGIGMGREVLERAFDPFFTTKDACHGTGLGLFMVYDFARKSDGAVQLSSEPGKGTTVEVLLPRCTSVTAGDD